MRRLLVTVAGVALAAALAWAQPLVPNSWTGNEIFEVQLGGPGGTAAFIQMAQVRNATAAVIAGITTGTFNSTNLMNRIIFGAALTGAVTLNTPPNPFDGEMMEVVNGTGVAFTFTITVTASSGQTVNSGALATLAPNSSGEFQYVLATTTWYRIR